MKYKHLFFDLDHTLWDYDTSAKQTLYELYDRYDLDAAGAGGKELLLKCFYEVNDGLWDDYNKGNISKYYLRTERFNLVFAHMGINPKLLKKEQADGFNHDYVNECAQKPNLIEGALEVLDELKSGFKLYIITNGFVEVQQTKIDVSGLTDYFDVVITSEEAGQKKPSAGIFKYATKKCGAIAEEAVMIGDNLQTDIKGARDFGWDQVYFNPHSHLHSEDVTHEIQRLPELLPILTT